MSIENFEIGNSIQAFINIGFEKKWIKSIVEKGSILGKKVHPEPDWKHRNIEINSGTFLSSTIMKPVLMLLHLQGGPY